MLSHRTCEELMRTSTVFLGTEPEAAIVRAYLEDNGVQAMLEGANVATVAPHLATPAGVGSVKVVVAEEDAERARSLIDKKGVE